MLSTIQEKLKLIIIKALADVYTNDSPLIDSSGLYDISDDNTNEKFIFNSERSVVFRFGIYLEKYLQKDFCMYNLDCEYNRSIYNKKKFFGDKDGIFPDLIIHKRGENNESSISTNNLMIIECKTWWSKGKTDVEKIKDDKEKINRFVCKKDVYKYNFGLSLIFKKTFEETLKTFEWFFDCENASICVSIKQCVLKNNGHPGNGVDNV